MTSQLDEKGHLEGNEATVAVEIAPLVGYPGQPSGDAMSHAQQAGMLAHSEALARPALFLVAPQECRHCYCRHCY